MDKLHSFAGAAARIPLPDKFTYPFHYTPHPLCVMAAGEVQRYLMSVDVWQEELRKGKMFGVLVVRTSRGEVGFLAAFSGILAGKNQHAYFVPPVYDVQEPGGFFEVEEEQISAINERIRQLQEDTSYAECRQRLSAETLLARLEQDEMKNQMKEAKEQRERLRQEYPDDATLEILTRESQFQKAELKRLKQHWNTRLLSLQAEIEAFETEIERLRTERKTRSAALQQRLFKQFQMLDACGRKRDLCDIFQDTAQKVPRPERANVLRRNFCNTPIGAACSL